MTKILNRRQARWGQELGDYNLKIFFQPESAKGKPDIISRRSVYCPKKLGGSAEENQRLLIMRIL
jgi:hypothetical protein